MPIAVPVPAPAAARVPAVPRLTPPAAVLLTVLLLAAMLPPAARAQAARGAQASASSGTRQRTRVQLRSLRARIHAMSRQSSRDAAERERLTAELRTAELAIGKARADLASSTQALAAQDAQRTALTARRTATARGLATARAGLAAEVRAAYLLQRDGPLRLLLDQKSPLASERLMMYYGYVGRAAADRIARIGGDVQRLDALDTQLTHQQTALSALQQQQALELQALSAARAQRAQVLVSLTARARTRSQQLAELQSQQAGLERLLQRLSRTPRAPRTSAGLPAPAAPDLSSAFGRLHGQLVWPVSGRLSAQFGQPRASGVSWDGVVIATARDTPVHAISGGRVVYADWLPGLGLLVIIDHGGGYLSLYAHNDRLFEAVGATVAAGDVIAAAGDTGGRAEPQLYFEIRHDGRPIDPTPWFRTRAPMP